MPKPQFIRTEAGEELVVLARRDYDRLLAGVADDADEDALAAALLRRTRERLDRGEEVSLPETVWERIEAGLHPILAIRTFRRLTQAELATAAGITQGFLSEIENRKKTGDVTVLARVAKALSVPLDVVVPDVHAPAPSSAASSPGKA